MIPISRQGVKVFPVQTHGLWKLQGPLAVEGGVTGADRSLQLGLKLPGEKDGPLFKIGTQPPESKQIDVLNIFNDGSKEDGEGTMTSTTLSGFGLAKDLDFGPTYSSGNPQTFGEPAIFPGGIGFGTVQFVDGKFDTNGAKTTIEVVNFLLGIGNDELDVQGTLDPDVPVKTDRHDHLTPRPAGMGDAGGIDLTRPLPFDWKAQGFLVGQPVEISGFPGLDGRSSGSPTTTRPTRRTGPACTSPARSLRPRNLEPVYTAFSSAAMPVTLAPARRWFGHPRRRRLDQRRLPRRAARHHQWRPALAREDDHRPRDDADGAALPAWASRTISIVVQTVTADDVPVEATVPITRRRRRLRRLRDAHRRRFVDRRGFLEGQLVMIQGSRAPGASGGSRARTPDAAARARPRAPDDHDADDA